MSTPRHLAKPTPGGRKSRKRTSRKKQRRQLSYLTAALLFLAAPVLAYVAIRQYPGMAALFLLPAALLLALEAGLLVFRRAPRVCRILIPALALCLLSGSIFASRYVLINRTPYPKSQSTLALFESGVTSLSGVEQMNALTTINLRGTQVTEFSPLAACRSLRYIDLRENYTFTPEAYQTLKAQLPECEIVWSMPILGDYFDSSATAIDLTPYEVTHEQIASLIQTYPKANFLYSIPVFGIRADSLDAALDLQNLSIDNISELHACLDLLPALNTVDMRGCALSQQDMDALSDGYPRIQFLFSFAIGGVQTNSLAQELDLSGRPFEDFEGFHAYARYLPELRRVNLQGSDLSFEEMDRLTAAYPDLTFSFSFTMFGVEVNTETTEINLSKKQIPGIDEVEKYLPYLPNLAYINMSGCGISNEDMALLRDNHPEIKVVWTVTFGKYTLRTDATAFSTLLTGRNRYSYNSRTFEPLKYCTDLEALDLGHNKITDISFLSGMTKMKILILACNQIRDLSPLSGMEHLQYVELFTNKITDFSALADKKELLDLNVCRNNVKSIAPILSCSNLERLWVGSCGLSSSQLKEIKNTLAECKINTGAGEAPTTGGWRVHPRYDTMKKIFKIGVYIEWE